MKIKLDAAAVGSVLLLIGMLLMLVGSVATLIEYDRKQGEHQEHNVTKERSRRYGR